jgi:23S rRNA (guanosine2251-2'-O)-methyltransferase
MSWMWGIHAVESMLNSSPESVDELWLVKSRKPGAARERVLDLAVAMGVRYRLVEDAQLRKAVGDVVHQGVAARASEFSYADPSELLAVGGPSCIVVLDGVQDPHNLGAILRTACGLGVTGVVIPRHRAASVTSTVRKVAVGAEQRIAVSQVANLSRFLEAAEKAEFWRYAAVSEGGEAIPGIELAERTVLVLGAESTGVRPNVRAHCDVSVTLPLSGVESLNVSVAAALMIYEWARPRLAAAPRAEMRPSS